MDEKTVPKIPQYSSKSRSRAKSTEAHRLIERIEKGEDVDLGVHDAAAIFPQLPKPKRAELAADIKARGLIQPITLHPDGTILDGVNRYDACRHVGQPPKFEVWDGRPGEEVDYVISKNLRRRHLSTRQRAVVAGRIAKLKRGRPKQANLPDITLAKAAQDLNVSERSARKGRQIADHAPEIIVELVEQDELSLSDAEAVARAPDEVKAQIASLPQAEARLAAKALAQKKDASLAGENSKATPLIRRLKGFLTQWSKATEEAREQLRDWLQLEANVVALDALRTMAVPTQQGTAKLDAKS